MLVPKLLVSVFNTIRCVNGGKSLFNEDQASAVELNMEFTNHSNSSEKENPLHHLVNVAPIIKWHRWYTVCSLNAMLI